MSGPTLYRLPVARGNTAAGIYLGAVGAVAGIVLLSIWTTTQLTALTATQIGGLTTTQVKGLTATTLSLVGANTQGALTPGNSAQLFKFTGTANTRLFFNWQSPSDGNAYYQVFGPDNCTAQA